MSNIIPFTRPQPVKNKCAFCGRTEEPGQRIVIGQDGKPCICSDCVKQAKDRIKETQEEGGQL